MENTNPVKLASLTLDIPYKRAGNVISQHQVLFDIYKDAANFRAVPQLNEDERRMANLPETLVFFFENGKVKSPRKIDGNFHVIEALVARLHKTSVLDISSGD